MKSKITSLLLTLFALIPALSNCQIAISNTNEIVKIKLGTTFFAMKDPASSKVTAYVDAIKKNWTLSKVECIKYSDVEKNIAPNNSFVTIGAQMTNSNSTGISETDFRLEFWTTNGKFVYDPKKRKHFNLEDKIMIASVELFPDFFLQNNPSSAYKIDYDSAGHLKNWSAGVLGNYIGQVVTLLNTATARETKTDFLNKSELSKISTLYIPDYVLTKFSKNSEDESKKLSPKELSDTGGLSYKILTTEELDAKILNDKTPFYYLLLIKTNTGKWITVTNSETGEIIYSSSGSSANFKPSDLKDLQKSIQKK